MNTAVLEVIEFELKHDFYFINHPVNVENRFWKDGNGELKIIAAMELQHLKSCITIVKRALENIKKSNRKVQVVDELVPLAEEKLTELNEELNRR